MLDFPLRKCCRIDFRKHKHDEVFCSSIKNRRDVISMLRGKVKWFNNTKGYGFIQYGDLEDIFVHYSAIKKDGYKTLKEGNVVDFKLIETAKGLQAVDVEEIQYVMN